MLYQYLKIIHILSVVLWAGNVLVTAYWKFYADKTQNSEVVGYSQRLITQTDMAFSLLFSIIVAGTGYGMAIVANYDLFGTTWLIWGQITFWFAFIVWIFALIPLQRKMTRMSEQFENGGEIGEDYRKLTTYWHFLGIALAVALYANVYFMVIRPA